MVLAVEPMTTAGRAGRAHGSDGWAILSQDSSPAAHFEFTVAITGDGPRILTPWHEAGAQPSARQRRSRAAPAIEPSAEPLAAPLSGSATPKLLPSPVLLCARTKVRRERLLDPVAAAATAARAESPEPSRRKGS